MDWTVLSPQTIEALTARALLYLPRLGSCAILLFVFWLGSRFVHRIVKGVATTGGLDQSLIDLLSRMAGVGVWVFGIMTALGTLGVDVSALVTGLGLTGFALGFALKDVISNALSGILILIYQPFHKGDVINVTGSEGTVVEINLRYTVLQAQEKLSFVPNATLFTNTVVVIKSEVPS